MAAVVAQGGTLGPLVGAIDQGTSSTRFLVSATNHEERSLFPFESKASKPQREARLSLGGNVEDASREKRRACDCKGSCLPDGLGGIGAQTSLTGVQVHL